MKSVAYSYPCQTDSANSFRSYGPSSGYVTAQQEQDCQSGMITEFISRQCLLRTFTHMHMRSVQQLNRVLVERSGDMRASITKDPGDQTDDGRTV